MNIVGNVELISSHGESINEFKNPHDLFNMGVRTIAKENYFGLGRYFLYMLG